AEYVSMLSRPNDPYEVIEPKIELDDAQRIKAMGLEGVDYSPIQGRYYPEKNIGAHIMGFVGFVGDTKQGRYGLEGFFEKELGGKAGEVNIESTGKGETSSVSDKQTVIGEDGSDLILTINRSVQYETCRLLGESVKKHGASGGSVVIMDPKTGAILAMCAYPDYDPNNYRKVKDIDIYNNPVIFDQFEPGSTFKAITVAAAVDQNKVGPNTTYKDTGFLMIEGWPKPISNSDYATRGAHGITTINTVLQDSLNCGSIFAMQSIGPAVFSDYVKKFGFGEKTGIELETESSGNIANLTGKKIRPINAATASFGQGISATPIQVAASYAVMANGGMLVKPYLVKAVISPTGEQSLTQTTEIRRVIDKRTASLMTGMLVNAVENGHASKAKVPGYYVAGKTGTAQVASKTSKGYEKGNTIQTFVGYAPANDPKFVMITRLDDPKDSKFAESSAVPLFGEIANFVLNYYQVPQERKIEAK
ncbi:penicillin-binding protein 2, partial [Candidatus Falkowbacteria bacterium]|nr:penicillin-binding protein 2 [Candidatus Falkowbacteria bacterium]